MLMAAWTRASIRETGANNEVDCVALQADGKVLIGGYFTAVNGVSRSRIARLNADGTLDTGFNPAANNAVFFHRRARDGKVLIGGYFTSVNGINRSYVARLNPGGSVDTSFTNPAASDGVYSVAVQTDGKVIIGGDFGIVSGVSRFFIARLNANAAWMPALIREREPITLFHIRCGATGWQDSDRWRVLLLSTASRAGGWGGSRATSSHR
jgi:uncharacterized delta-60 repeat protein